MSIVIRGITYETLCRRGERLADDIGRDIAETRRVAYLLQDAEENSAGTISRYREELAAIKARADDSAIHLGRHVAHCAQGCKRATDGAVFAANVERSHFARAPHRLKPELPGATALAAMLQQGQTVEGIAAVYERDPSTIRAKVTQAGYSSTTGLPNHRRTADNEPAERPPIFEVPAWMADALCAQTDPEAFFPEKGGSTREAKAVCRRCPVMAECLDYALDNNERFGIFGGLSERDRRRITRHLDTKEAS